MKLLDMLPTGYNQDYVSELFRTLGENGREIYLTNQIPVDMIYPLLFGLTYSLKIKQTQISFYLSMLVTNNCWNRRLSGKYWDYHNAEKLPKLYREYS